MSTVITDAALADLYESIGRDGSHFRTAALAESTETSDFATDTLDDVRAALVAIPDSKLKTHDAECWQVHAACLAERMVEMIDGEPVDN